MNIQRDILCCCNHGVLNLSNFRYQGTVGHCLIYKENSHYGFTQQTCEFANINDLVDHYSRESLREHNQRLDVRLLHPVNKEPTAAGQQTVDSVNYLQMHTDMM